MPNIGDVTTAPKIGYAGRLKFIWTSCPDCDIERWRPLHNDVTRCWKCAANRRERERKPLTFIGIGTPKVGDTAKASTVSQSGRGLRVFAKCPTCDVTRWTRFIYKDTPCPPCTAKLYNSRPGDQHPKWKGGIKRSRGYVYVLIPVSDPLFKMSSKRYKNQAVIAEHRLVVARSVGRLLTRYEVVHHINGIKDDNRLENLRLLNEHDHHSSLVTQELQSRLVSHEARLLILETDNILLKSALQEIRDSIPEAIMNLRCYDTLGSLLGRQIEGIVRSSSNRGLDNNELA